MPANSRTKSSSAVQYGNRIVTPTFRVRSESGATALELLETANRRTRSRSQCAPRNAKLITVTTARRLHHSYEDYLAALEMSDVKLEYCDGEIYAMAGGTPAHADLAAAAIRLLSNSLLGRCRVSTSDLKLRIEATGLSTFPDVSVVCGERNLPASIATPLRIQRS